MCSDFSQTLCSLRFAIKLSYIVQQQMTDTSLVSHTCNTELQTQLIILTLTPIRLLMMYIVTKLIQGLQQVVYIL